MHSCMKSLDQSVLLSRMLSESARRASFVSLESVSTRDAASEQPIEPLPQIIGISRKVSEICKFCTNFTNHCDEL
ncbi:unnamed protein product [Adineta ricciae]|uniref:Uncharacterized protein n=1 Tax=Adineta ricciae TaxID=249248 RepID=A0A814FNH3_ADIRI|nr:unnamed protein product [Adineta ricciae]